jgi:hypothetical protein
MSEGALRPGGAGAEFVGWTLEKSIGQAPGDDLLCRTRHVAQSGAARDRLKGLKTAIRNIPGIGPVGIQTH